MGVSLLRCVDQYSSPLPATYPLGVDVFGHRVQLALLCVVLRQGGASAHPLCSTLGASYG